MAHPFRYPDNSIHAALRMNKNAEAFLRHPTDKSAGLFVFDECYLCPDMTAAHARTGKILRYFVHINVAVADFDEQLHRTLQPDVQAAHTSCFDDDAIVQVAQGCIFKPAHQKSSADGIRL